ncbi:transmembrane channel-like protein 4 [Chanos chanos]|uniref:Transmembrane channel-like protein n=1 Tax=Chanos chanos TaxID=29144 RepID=A0A6J2W7B2_CHACN|nr:transmembrane channel-like protein 4 [Chanos chanos]
MELTEFGSQGSLTAHRGYHGYQQSLRARTTLPREANNNSPQLPSENGPQFGWGSTPTPEEAGDSDKNQSLRELPLHMGLKRAVWQVQKMQVPVVSRWGSGINKYTKALKRFRKNAMGILVKFVLWRKVIQKIGGHFGGGVQSYFLFLRFLIVLNFLSFLLIAAFVLIPNIVFEAQGSSVFSRTGNVTENTNTTNCEGYDHGSDTLTPFYQYFLDLLSGTGFMEYSYLFYGFYQNTAVISNGFSYNIPLAYLLTAAFYFLFCLVCIIVSMGSALRVITAAGGGAVGGYSTLVFTGWDHGLQGDRATKLKQQNLRHQFQVELEEERFRLKAASQSLGQTVGMYVLRIFLNLVVFALLGGAFYSIFVATRFSQSRQEEGFLGLLLEYLPSIVITVENFVVPFLFGKITILENYTPSVTVIMALLRAVFLRLVSLAVLLYTLWAEITCGGKPESAECLPCNYNYNRYQCWETRVGQEMYKLTLFDLLTTLAVLILVEFPRRLAVDHCSCALSRWLGRQEFEVPSNVLAVVYGQTVVWTGALFCPLLPVINTIKFIIFFYCKKVTLFQNCRPASRTFRSTSSNFFFFVVLLLGWALASVTLIYSVAVIHPSYGCGPFRSLLTMWTIVPATFYSLPNTTQEFLFYIGSQKFSIPLFLSSCVLLCFTGALASVYGRSVAQLKIQHKNEGRDKQFLVKQIKEMSEKQGKIQDNYGNRGNKENLGNRENKENLGNPEIMGSHGSPQNPENHGNPEGQKHGTTESQENHGSPEIKENHGTPENHWNPEEQNHGTTEKGENRGTPENQENHGNPEIKENLGTQENHGSPEKNLGATENKEVHGAPEEENHGNPESKENHGTPENQENHWNPGNEKHGRTENKEIHGTPEDKENHGDPENQDNPQNHSKQSRTKDQ